MIDEISTKGTCIFVALDTIFRQAYNGGLPFFLKRFFLLLYFLQTKTVAGNSLAGSLVMYLILGGAITSPGSLILVEDQTRAYSAAPFRNFRRFFLTQQIHAATDPMHCERLQGFTLDRREPHLNPTFLSRLLLLSSHLFLDDPYF